MNADLHAALRYLSAPGAMLIEANIPEFGFHSKTIEGPGLYALVTDETFIDLRLNDWIILASYNGTQRRYTLTIAGALALADAEKAPVHE